MSKRAILSLAVIALGLAVYVFLFERDSVTSKDRHARAGRVLVSFVRDKVDHLSVQRKGARVVLARKPLDDGLPGGFVVLEPFAAKADDSAVDQLLGELEWLSARRTLDALSSADAKTFGLEAPRYRVTFAVAGEEHVLAVGNPDVHGDSIYVRVDREARAYVVPKTLLEALDHEPGHYRDKQLYPELTVAWARKLELSERGQRRALVREQGRWWLAETPKVHADNARVEELLHALSELRAAHYLDASTDTDALFAVPALRLEVVVVPDETREDKQAKIFVLELAGPCAGHKGERYVRSSSKGAGTGLLSCVADAELKPFELADTSLREPRLFASEPSSVLRFVLTRGAEKLALARAGEGWKSEGVAAPVDRAAVEAWLSDLAAARAHAFLPLSAFTERGRLTLELADKRSERIAIGDLNSAGELVVKRGDEPLLVSFSGSVFDRLQPTVDRFQALEPWSAHQPSEVVRVRAESGKLARVLTLEQGSWRSSDAATSVDSERIRELVRSLIDLHAEAYLTTQVRPDHGFGSANPHVELTLSKGAPLSLELGAPTDRGGYALIDRQRVFEVKRELRALVNELAGGMRSETPAAPPEPADEEDSDQPAHDHAH
ncbi:MAG: hypothetical protein JWN04_2262 [Myxococcaceae bacterium]|nr:hypothetical protein [Myxococcaceae bacterium]